jgi:hypothetical protein
MPETSIEPGTEGENEVVPAVFYWQDEPDYEYAWWWDDDYGGPTEEPLPCREEDLDVTGHFHDQSEARRPLPGG